MQAGCDTRIKVFEKHRNLIEKKDVLDIGCNDGYLTLEIARLLNPKSMTGIDIDKKLIEKAKKSLRYMAKTYPGRIQNVTFEHGNYVILGKNVFQNDDFEKFDTILCLSVTKWIQLNFGDEGIEQTFKRIYSQLRPNGVLVLEAQPFKSYGRRKKLSQDIFNHYKNIKLFPEDYEKYLLAEIGFAETYSLKQSYDSKGFNRSIQVFVKKIVN